MSWSCPLVTPEYVRGSSGSSCHHRGRVSLAAAAAAAAAAAGCSRRRLTSSVYALLLVSAAVLQPLPAVRACIPGRHGGRRQRDSASADYERPLVRDEFVPKVSEHTLVASGLPEGPITRDEPGFLKLVFNNNPDVVFKDEEGTGADYYMTKRCAEMVDALAVLVRNRWPGVLLRVTEAWDEEGAHAVDSLHYEGRAVDLTTSDQDHTKYGMLARLAVRAGFDWVLYQSWTHIHASVLSDSSEAIKWGGCFSSSSTVRLSSGVSVPMTQLAVGDQVLAVEPASGRPVFTPVLTFMDRRTNESRLFASITTSSGRSITLTPSHILYTLHTDCTSGTSEWDGRVDTKFARDIKVGDTLLYLTEGDSSEVRLSTVTDVRFHYSKGVYAPLTESGTIVVDDVAASCYAVINSNTVAHWSFAPLRWYYYWKEKLYGAPSGDGKETRDGVHWYARTLYGVARYTLPDDWLYGVSERKRHLQRDKERYENKMDS